MPWNIRIVEGKKKMMIGTTQNYKPMEKFCEKQVELNVLKTSTAMKLNSPIVSLSTVQRKSA